MLGKVSIAQLRWSTDKRSRLSTEDLVCFELKISTDPTCRQKYSTHFKSLPISRFDIVGPFQHDIVGEGERIDVGGSTSGRVDLDILVQKLDSVVLRSVRPPSERFNIR